MRRGGALYPLIESGRLTDAHIHAEIGDRMQPSPDVSADERILLWHRGFAISDIVLVCDPRSRRREGVGTMLPPFEATEE
jgi:ornithine cyclodeaminase